MRNWTRGYCNTCGETIFHRNRCFMGHPVSAEAPIRIKEVKHRKRKTDDASLFSRTGAADRPQGIE